MISIVFDDAARIYRTVICATYNSAAPGHTGDGEARRLARMRFKKRREREREREKESYKKKAKVPEQSLTVFPRSISSKEYQVLYVLIRLRCISRWRINTAFVFSMSGVMRCTIFDHMHAGSAAPPASMHGAAAWAVEVEGSTRRFL